MNTAIDIATDQIKIDEGLRLTPYLDTENILTIGYGRNLEHNGITESEAEHMLRNDLRVAEEDAVSFVTSTVWQQLDAPRRAVLINMAFNLGLTRLSKFKKFKQALHDHDYHEAARQMLDSRWSRQVGERSHRLADSMRG
jgi:lysozyme